MTIEYDEEGRPVFDDKYTEGLDLLSISRCAGYKRYCQDYRLGMQDYLKNLYPLMLKRRLRKDMREVLSNPSISTVKNIAREQLYDKYGKGEKKQYSCSKDESTRDIVLKLTLKGITQDNIAVALGKNTRTVCRVIRELKNDGLLPENLKDINPGKDHRTTERGDQSKASKNKKKKKRRK